MSVSTVPLKHVADDNIFFLLRAIVLGRLFNNRVCHTVSRTCVNRDVKIQRGKQQKPCSALCPLVLNKSALPIPHPTRQLDKRSRQIVQWWHALHFLHESTYAYMKSYFTTFTSRRLYKYYSRIAPWLSKFTEKENMQETVHAFT